MSAVSLILGDQLFEDFSGLPSQSYLMVEDRELASQFPYHWQKLVLTFSAMRHFAVRLGTVVDYYRLEAGISINMALQIHRDRGVSEVHCIEPADRFFGENLRGMCESLGLNLIVHPNPMFLTGKNEWEQFSASRPTAIMADFYRWQRKRLNILLDSDGHPAGGQWSFDSENRKKLPRGHVPPAVWFPSPDGITREVMATVSAEFPAALGRDGEFIWPVDHEGAREWLNQFLEERIDLFGAYEDAISRDHPFLYHSWLTPMLNIGLLTPRQVLDAVFDRHSRRPIPLNSLEGFVRQVVGWREYVKCIDGEDRWRTADLSVGRRLDHCWYEGTTGLPPLDDSIGRALTFGWCHHIERLMLMGSVMYMCGIRPADALEFFMRMFVDATEWVMAPNVLGMSQFVALAFATKPYFSGSAYVLRMSDYRTGSWCEVWDGLYWRKVDRDRVAFAKNPRMKPILANLERMESSKKGRLFGLANEFTEASTIA